MAGRQFVLRLGLLAGVSQPSRFEVLRPGLQEMGMGGDSRACDDAGPSNPGCQVNGNGFRLLLHVQVWKTRSLRGAEGKLA